MTLGFFARSTLELLRHLLAEGGLEPPSRHFTRTHCLRPAENTTDKRRTGNLRVLPLNYSGIGSRRPDSNRRPRAYEAITQSCDPLKMANDGQRDGFDVSGRESNPHLLVFTRCSDAVQLPSSITEAQRPILRKRTTDKRREGNSSVARWCAV